MSPCCLMLSAFCSADRFVAERHEWRLAASGPRSERHITDQRNAKASSIEESCHGQVERPNNIIHAEGVREYCSTDN
jgi:hypothetical protein